MGEEPPKLTKGVIAHIVSEVVIEALQTVHVGDDQADHRSVLVTLVHGPIEFLFKQPSIGDTRELIGEGVSFDTRKMLCLCDST